MENNNTTLKAMQELNLTELETQVLKSFINGLYAEAGFSDIDANDLSKWTGIPMKVIRGVIGSLIKKDIMWVEDNGEYVIIYLSMQFWYLHPNPSWKEQADEWYERFKN